MAIASTMLLQRALRRQWPGRAELGPALPLGLVVLASLPDAAVTDAMPAVDG